MSSQHLFLSDVHFGAFSKRTHQSIEQDLSALLEFCSRWQISITILGDLFDYWMEYPGGHYPTLGSRLLERFRKFMQDSGPILYITGNHDNWTRGYFRQLGFDVEPEYRFIHLDGRKVLLHHGDGLSAPEMNLSRPGLHRLLRHPRFVTLYQGLLPATAGLRLMQWFSNYSRTKSNEDPTRLDHWSKEYLRKTDTDFVICGHDHIPREKRYPSGIFFNCGSFYSHRTAIYYTKGQFRLVVWDSRQQKITPFRRFKT